MQGNTLLHPVRRMRVCIERIYVTNTRYSTNCLIDISNTTNHAFINIREIREALQLPRRESTAIRVQLILTNILQGHGNIFVRDVPSL